MFWIALAVVLIVLVLLTAVKQKQSRRTRFPVFPQAMILRQPSPQMIAK